MCFFQLVVIVDALAPLVEAQVKVAAARAECLAVCKKLEEKKKAVSEFEQRAKSAES